AALRLAGAGGGPLLIDRDIGLGFVVGGPAGLGVKPGRPVHVIGVLLAGDERAVGAVERVEIAVAGGVDDKLAVLAVHLGVDDRVLGDFVEVIGIVGRVLIAPFDLAVGRAERQHARGPFVVARAIFRVPIRASVADALIEGVGFRIVGRGLPHRSAAVLPAILAVLPGLVAGLASARDRVGAPGRLAGVEVGR